MRDRIWRLAVPLNGLVTSVGRALSNRVDAITLRKGSLCAAGAQFVDPEIRQKKRAAHGRSMAKKL